MTLLLLIGAVILLTIVPQWWVNRVFAEYNHPRDDIPGTGGQLAVYLIQRAKVEDAMVIEDKQPSHFNPENKTIVLSPEYYNGKSLTAIAIAAHEIGHLIQQNENNTWLYLRTHLATWAQKADRAGIFALFLMPFASFITKSPSIGLLLIGVGFSSMIINVIAQLITLPMELDASFNKALPILIDGGFVSKADEPGLRRVLKAASYTYLASALAGLVNLARWVRVFKR